MAGERLYELMTGKGGKDSDYADVVYGTVISVSPLKVQIANNMVITDDFIELGRHIGKFKLQGKAVFKGTMNMTFHSHNDTANVKETDLKFPEPKHDSGDKPFYIEFDNSLEKGDKVTMIRCDGGQRFYLFERTCEKGFGF